MSATPSTEIRTRDEFPLLCDWRRFETAVEVGVDRGTFSQLFFSCRTLRQFIGVDPYVAHPEFPHRRDGDLAVASTRYARCDFASLMRAGSTEIAYAIANNTLGHIKEGVVDFVYIDAGHTYDEILRDLELWWPLVSDRGILAGHDYDHTHPDVIRAVDEFGVRYERTIYITQEHPNSWYCYKSGMPGADWHRV